MGGRTQKEFAEWVGDSPKKVNGYLLGEFRPALDFMERLALKGVNVNWLLTGKGNIYLTYQQAKELPEIQQLLHEIDNDAELARSVTEFVRGMIKAKAQYSATIAKLDERKKTKKNRNHFTP